MKTRENTVIGTRPIRPDGVAKVTGRAQFGADFRLPGLLYGSILRSPHAHARIRHIDTSKAAALDGVKAVVTAADLPEGPDRSIDYGEGVMKLSHLRGNILAKGKVLYKGHAMAAVAAVNSHVAAEAADLIEVEYEVLPCVLNVLDAMREDAPLLIEDLKTVEFSQETGKTSNIAER
ncbi:MAG: xanthine dehydrogenase family protein molybdopterin-binding subunit, partial [bacterium]|nr:xanthine dehydrogenase family protein molybdopterin-binding subunit [bacterium]